MTKLIFDDTVILVGAFRYALGRMTYFVSITADRIIHDWEKLPPHTQDLIREEIVFAIEHNNAGAPCDVEQWRRILSL